MSIKYTTTDQYTAAHGVKMLVYGAAGSGKTTFCGTAPNPLIISAEAGLMSLRKKSLKVAEVGSFADVREVLTTAQNGTLAKWGIKTICLDSISEIVEKCLVDHKSRTKDPRQAYGSMADDAIELVKAFRDISGMHVIVTAKQTTQTDAITNVVKATPQSPGQQVGPALPYLFDLVLHAFTDKAGDGTTYHALRTHAAFNAEAKDRSGALDELEYPDAENIINKILQR